MDTTDGNRMTPSRSALRRPPGALQHRQGPSRGEGMCCGGELRGIEAQHCDEAAYCGAALSCRGGL